MNKCYLILGLLFFVLFSSFGCNKDDAENNQSDDKSINHPRILLLKGEEQQIKDLINADPTWAKMHRAILTECSKILAKSPVERVLIGRRLLDKSRECLRRVFYLSYAYRMTGKEVYFIRAESELLAVANFSDWNPSHFLDVAEMTMGVAIGYDWLYDKLSEESRKKISDAIVSKGLYPSLDSDYNWFLTSSNNWNQVCNAGMTYGALAVQEDYPELSTKIIDRAFETIKLSMAEYQPDGVYPEGYGYWGYGSSFNVMFLSAVEKVLGSDGGLTSTPGFLKTSKYLEHVLAPSGKCFNYSDCGLGGNLNPAMFWFAEKSDNPSLLWSENKFLQNSDFSKFTGDRLLPAIMIWGKNIPLDQISEPSEKSWMGQGANPVAMMRTSWTDEDAVFLGFKAGSPSVNHSHMDVGSFVMEADGVRWASDPGMQNYESLESKGMSIFGRTQDAQRWTIYRMNNHSHNVLTVNDELQKVSGYAKIDKFSDTENFRFAVSDISSVYKDLLKKAVRGVAIKDEKYVVVRDEIETPENAVKVKWAIFTFASVDLGEKSATLTIGDKKLYLKVEGPENLTMKTWSTAPTNDYDAQNPGTVMVGFECDIPANTSESFEVLLVPEKYADVAVSLDKTLNNW